MGEQPRGVQVTGDLLVIWQLAVPLANDAVPRGMGYAREPATAWIASLPGGAPLQRTLIADAGRESEAGGTGAAEAPGVFPVWGPELPSPAAVEPGSDLVARQYSLWRPFPRLAGDPATAWRLAQLLGREPARDGAPAGAGAGAMEGPSTEPGPGQTPSCLVVMDAGLSFRDEPGRWPATLRRLGEDGVAGPPQILLQQAADPGRGALWEHLSTHAGDRLTVVCPVSALRAVQAEIGQPLSWERTASEVVRAVAEHPTLGRRARVIVLLGMCGAVGIERDGPCTLLYDPLFQEGDWEASRPGVPFGSEAAVVTALALALALARGAPESGPDWPGAVARGLTAGRVVHETGFLSEALPAEVQTVAGGLRFPVREVLPLLAGRAPAPAFERVEVPPEADWRILQRAAQGGAGLAGRIAVEGVEAAGRGVPVERMGAWTSVDRTEIESLRSVRNIVQEYLRHPRPRPLSLAVFGPPGAGKSFAIKQMARAWTAGGSPLAVLEFNLSQFGSLDDLPGALQRVRDSAVEGRLPLVFWDEFDSAREGRPLGWLASFLAPMQDGTFVEQGAVRPIGAAVFVFAGGTHPTMGAFKDRAVEHAAAKATDFLSRLRGFVDTLGPNPAGPEDETYPLRRALLLRAIVSGRAPRLLQGGRLRIDPGVLRAFLTAPAYLHGARSLESIVEMSALTGALSYERAALPAAHQLAMHVDAEAFLRLVREPSAP